MTTAQRTWLTPQAHARLQSELASLRALLTGDREDATVAAQRTRRVQQIHELLHSAVIGEDPADDGIAEPGMVLTVRFDDTGDIETFLLGVRGAEYGEIEVYSPDSPLGAALLGSRPGQQRTYPVPSGARLPVTLLAAVPYGRHAVTGQS